MYLVYLIQSIVYQIQITPVIKLSESVYLIGDHQKKVLFNSINK